MLALFKKRDAASVASQMGAAAPHDAASADAGVHALAQTLQRDTSGLGLEAAQLRGTLEDSAAVAERQVRLVQAARVPQHQTTQQWMSTQTLPNGTATPASNHCSQQQHSSAPRQQPPAL